MLTGSLETRAIVATTALESTPPERNAPSGTSEIMRRRIDSSSRRFSSSQASGSVIGLSSVKRTSQYSTGSGSGWPRLTVSRCAGGSLRVPVKMVRGSAT